jgi:hypothetical protein
MQKEVQKGRPEEAVQETTATVSKRAVRRRLFTLNEELNAILRAIYAREKSYMAASFIVMTVKICITNQAFPDITKIKFQIQKMTLCHACHKEDNADNNIVELPQNADYDSDIREQHVLAT